MTTTTDPEVTLITRLMDSKVCKFRLSKSSCKVWEASLFTFPFFFLVPFLPAFGSSHLFSLSLPPFDQPGCHFLPCIFFPLPCYHLFLLPFPPSFPPFLCSPLLPSSLSLVFISFSLCVLLSLLVVGAAALPLAVVIHAGCADGAGDEVGGAGGHEVGHCRRDVHPLVCHQIICSANKNTSYSLRVPTCQLK